RQVVRVHPIVHALSARELAVVGDACLEVWLPDMGWELPQYRERRPPRPREIDRFGDRAVGLLGKCHVRPGVVDDGLPQRGVDMMWQYLVDPATRHHISAQEDGRAGIPRHTSSVHR